MNKVFFSQAWDSSRNIGKYYNEFMSMLPDDSYGCLMDYDTMFLTNDYGKHIYEYVNQFQDAVLTCRTNRMHTSNDFQQLQGIDRGNHDINYHRSIADQRKQFLYETTDISKPDRTKLMGGMLMLVPKKIWKECPFNERGILDVDNDFHKDLIAKDKQVLIMEGIYIYHWYRQNGGKDHLL